MDDFLNVNLMEEGFETPKLTAEEFILKTKSMLKSMVEEYKNSHSPKYDYDDESEENCCDRCNGTAVIEQGGDIVDCHCCNGTGLNSEIVFDSDSFSEFIVHEVMFGDKPFYELLEGEIVSKKETT